jgi:glutathione S-transferase
MIKLYGSARSRAARCLWMLEELGQEYEHLDLAGLDADDALQTVTRVNPIGKVPALEDGETRLFESMAINLYLAAKYGGPLWPSDVNAQGLATAWSIWGMTEMEPPLAQLFLERVMRKEAQRDRQNEAQALETLQRPLDALESYLAGLQFLLGDRFTVADLNLASVLTLMNRANFDLQAYPNTGRWRRACYDRPAYQKIYPNQPPPA